MARVGTCKDCGARFKVPEATTATRAKCAKCGGVVEIPSVQAAPAASAAAAPATRPSVAPSRTAAKLAASAPAPGDAPVPTSSRRGAASKAGSRSAGKSGARKAAGKGRSRGDGAEEKKSPMGMIVVVVVLVAALGGGAFFLLGGDDAPTATPDSAQQGASGQPGGTDAAAAANLASPSGSSAASAPAASSSLTDGVNAPDSAAAAGTANTDPGVAPAPVAQAPAPAADASAGKSDPAVPLSTVLEFELLKPLEGYSQEDLDNWTTLVRTLYVEFGGATGRERKRLKDQLEAISPIDAVPAYINALHGVDLAEDSAINGVFNLCKDWQDRVAQKPKFYFSGDVTDKSVERQNDRVIVILNQWIPWWLDKLSSPIKMEDYRELVASELKKFNKD